MKWIKTIAARVSRTLRRMVRPSEWHPWSVITDQRGIILFQGEPQAADRWMQSHRGCGDWMLTCTTNFFRVKPGTLQGSNTTGVGRRDSGSDVPHHPLVGGTMGDKR
jgi:hypothetical protein